MPNRGNGSMRQGRPLRSLRRRRTGSIPDGQHYDPHFVQSADRARILEWLPTIPPPRAPGVARATPPPGGAALLAAQPAAARTAATVAAPARVLARQLAVRLPR